MGYDYHITLADDWADNSGAQIPPDEWLAVVHRDSELFLTSVNGPYFVEWRDFWFDLVSGNVDAKNPDTQTLDKMLALASQLNARVQGDDGDIYDGAEPVDTHSPNIIIASVRFFGIYVLVVLGLSLLSTFVCYLFGMFER